MKTYSGATPVALVVGEALVDVVRRPDQTDTPMAGGSAANAAVALARLGRPVWFRTAWGQDRFGALLAAQAERNGVRLAGDPHVLQRTASATATIGTDGAASYDFDIEWAPGPVRLPQDVRPVVVCCGSIGAVLEPGAALVREVLAANHSTSLNYYDLNVRPQVTGTDFAVMARVMTVAGMAHLVKGSDEDLEALWPGVPEEDVAQLLFNDGVGAVVVTKGGEGATWWSPRGPVHMPGKFVDVADTIGAGDSFGAALVDALWSAGVVGPGAGAALQDLWVGQIRSLLDAASAAAAVAVSRPGADPPWAHELR